MLYNKFFNSHLNRYAAELIRGNRNRGVLNKFLCGKAPLTLLYIIFHKKRYSFRIPSIDKWYPFHIPCSELCIPFDCCKCTVF